MVSQIPMWLASFSFGLQDILQIIFSSIILLLLVTPDHLFAQNGNVFTAMALAETDLLVVLGVTI